MVGTRANKNGRNNDNGAGVHISGPNLNPNDTNDLDEEDFARSNYSSEDNPNNVRMDQLVVDPKSGDAFINFGADFSDQPQRLTTHNDEDLDPTVVALISALENRITPKNADEKDHNGNPALLFGLDQQRVKLIDDMRRFTDTNHKDSYRKALYAPDTDTHTLQILVKEYKAQEDKMIGFALRAFLAERMTQPDFYLELLYQMAVSDDTRLNTFPHEHEHDRHSEKIEKIKHKLRVLRYQIEKLYSEKKAVKINAPLQDIKNENELEMLINRKLQERTTLITALKKLLKNSNPPKRAHSVSLNQSLSINEDTDVEDYAAPRKDSQSHSFGMYFLDEKHPLDKKSQTYCISRYQTREGHTLKENLDAALNMTVNQDPRLLRMSSEDLIKSTEYLIVPLKEKLNEEKHAREPIRVISLWNRFVQWIKRLFHIHDRVHDMANHSISDDLLKKNQQILQAKEKQTIEAMLLQLENCYEMPYDANENTCFNDTIFLQAVNLTKDGFNIWEQTNWITKTQNPLRLLQPQYELTSEKITQLRNIIMQYCNDPDTDNESRQEFLDRLHTAAAIRLPKAIVHLSSHHAGDDRLLHSPDIIRALTIIPRLIGKSSVDAIDDHDFDYRALKTERDYLLDLSQANEETGIQVLEVEETVKRDVSLLGNIMKMLESAERALTIEAHKNPKPQKQTLDAVKQSLVNLKQRISQETNQIYDNSCEILLVGKIQLLLNSSMREDDIKKTVNECHENYRKIIILENDLIQFQNKTRDNTIQGTLIGLVFDYLTNENNYPLNISGIAGLNAISNIPSDLSDNQKSALSELMLLIHSPTDYFNRLGHLGLALPERLITHFPEYTQKINNAITLLAQRQFIPNWKTIENPHTITFIKNTASASWSDIIESNDARQFINQCATDFIEFIENPQHRAFDKRALFFIEENSPPQTKLLINKALEIFIQNYDGSYSIPIELLTSDLIASDDQKELLSKRINPTLEEFIQNAHQTPSTEELCALCVLSSKRDARALSQLILDKLNALSIQETRFNHLNCLLDFVSNDEIASFHNRLFQTILTSHTSPEELDFNIKYYIDHIYPLIEYNEAILQGLSIEAKKLFNADSQLKPQHEPLIILLNHEELHQQFLQHVRTKNLLQILAVQHFLKLEELDGEITAACDAVYGEDNITVILEQLNTTIVTLLNDTQNDQLLSLLNFAEKLIYNTDSSNPNYQTLQSTIVDAKIKYQDTQSAVHDAQSICDRIITCLNGCPNQDSTSKEIKTLIIQIRPLYQAPTEINLCKLNLILKTLISESKRVACNNNVTLLNRIVSFYTALLEDFHTTHQPKNNDPLYTLNENMNTVKVELDYLNLNYQGSLRIYDQLIYSFQDNNNIHLTETSESSEFHQASHSRTRRTSLISTGNAILFYRTLDPAKLSHLQEQISAHIMANSPDGIRTQLLKIFASTIDNPESCDNQHLLELYPNYAELEKTVSDLFERLNITSRDHALARDHENLKESLTNALSSIESLFKNYPNATFETLHVKTLHGYIRQIMAAVSISDNPNTISVILDFARVILKNVKNYSINQNEDYDQIRNSSLQQIDSVLKKQFTKHSYTTLDDTLINSIESILREFDVDESNPSLHLLLNFEKATSIYNQLYNALRTYNFEDALITYRDLHLLRAVLDPHLKSELRINIDRCFESTHLDDTQKRYLNILKSILISLTNSVSEAEYEETFNLHQFHTNTINELSQNPTELWNNYQDENAQRFFSHATIKHKERLIDYMVNHKLPQFLNSTEFNDDIYGETQQFHLVIAHAKLWKIPDDESLQRQLFTLLQNSMRFIHHHFDNTGEEQSLKNAIHIALILFDICSASQPFAINDFRQQLNRRFNDLKCTLLQILIRQMPAPRDFVPAHAFSLLSAYEVRSSHTSTQSLLSAFLDNQAPELALKSPEQFEKLKSTLSEFQNKPVHRTNNSNPDWDRLTQALHSLENLRVYVPVDFFPSDNPRPTHSRHRKRTGLFNKYDPSDIKRNVDCIHELKKYGLEKMDSLVAALNLTHSETNQRQSQWVLTLANVFDQKGLLFTHDHLGSLPLAWEDKNAKSDFRREFITQHNAYLQKNPHTGSPSDKKEYERRAYVEAIMKDSHIPELLQPPLIQALIQERIFKRKLSLDLTCIKPDVFITLQILWLIQNMLHEAILLNHSDSAPKLERYILTKLTQIRELIQSLETSRNNTNPRQGAGAGAAAGPSGESAEIVAAGTASSPRR